MFGKKSSLLALLLIAVMGLLPAFSDRKEKIRFVVPQGWPKPTYAFSRNELTKARFLLGNRLFFDPILSKDSTISCSSCHLSFTAFTHADHKLSHGIYGRQGFRNSGTLINLAWSDHFMWDGSVSSLDRQPLNPIRNPSEMDNSMDTVVAHLNHSRAYRGYFYDAFGDSLATEKRVLKALSAFTVMLVSCHSRYDSVMNAEYHLTFNDHEARGYALFKRYCATCHPEPLFTNQGFENNGLPVDTALNDLGRFRVTGKPADRLKFKVPTLRNVEYSAPYFHDGRCRKLGDAVEHYASGIIESPTLSNVLRQKLPLTKQDKKDLITFLKTLTDKAFLYEISFRPEFPAQFQNN